MTQWEIWDQLMAEDEERRVRVARWQAVIEKRKAAEHVTKEKKIQLHYGDLPKLRPGEGRITRTAKECTTTVYYSEADIERVGRKTPWLLPELLKELEENENESTNSAAV